MPARANWRRAGAPRAAFAPPNAPTPRKEVEGTALASKTLPYPNPSEDDSHGSRTQQCDTPNPRHRFRSSWQYLFPGTRT
ncbi:MAG TPA: hypothetical protein DCF77_14715, partial [Pseudomonas sp.]|nr:hypothetical protein [Pseudomonas sp.]